MAVHDFTVHTEAEGYKDTFPIQNAMPVDGINKEFWRKVRLDFSKTNLADGTWAKIMVIPAHTRVKEVMTCIVTPEGAASGIGIGDVDADHSVTWVAAQDGDAADVTKITLVADANGATRGKYYHAAGALYLSATALLDTLVIDVYAHMMIIDP